MKKFLLNLLSPLNVILFNYFVKKKFILFCGGGGDRTVIEQAAPRDMGEDARSYLEAVTDPELVGKQLDAERQFGPQFDLVSLARTQTMLEGIKDPKESLAYKNAQAKRIALQAKKKSIEDGNASIDQSTIDAQIDELLGPRPKQSDFGATIPKDSRGWPDKNNRISAEENYQRALVSYNARREPLELSYKTVNTLSTAEIEADLAENLAVIKNIEESPAQKGLLEMAQEAATAYAKTIRESNTLQREADIVDLENLGQRTTEALREADPYSTGIADKATQLAEQASTRALEGVQPTAERTAMGEIANRQRERISELETRAEEARTPAENEELNRLKQLRDQQQTALLDPALARAADPSSVAERQNLSMLADQSMAAAQAPTDAGFLAQQDNQQRLGRMGMSAATVAQARANNPMLADGRAELGQLANVAQAQALDPTSNAQRASMGDLANVAQGFAMDPTSNAERAELGNMAQQSRDFASSLMQQAQNPALPNAERQRLIAMSQQQEQRANDMYARAGDVSPEQRALRDSATAMRARGDDMFARAGDVSADQQALLDSATGMRARADQMFDRAGDVSPEQQELRNKASAMQQRAQGLFAQAEAAPSEQKQQLQAAAMDMMNRGKGLFEQSKQISAQRAQAGSLSRLSAQQARQLSADAMGPLSSQRRRMAEQAARQQGLRSGRIGDSAQLAAELLGREESKALLRAEAREAQDLAYQQAAGFATDVQTDADRLRTSALGFETGGFDRARGVEGDIDAQRLALLQEGRLTEGQGFDAGLGIESQISNQELARQGRALEAAQLGMQEGRGMTSQISDQEIARTGRALEASQLGMQEGRAMEDQISNQELARQQEARLTQGQAFDQGRGIQSDLDQLTADRRSQALAAQGDARLATTDLIGIDKGFRDEAFGRQQDLLTTDRGFRDEASERQQALLDRDEALREEARLEREAANLEQRGLFEQAQSLRNEAATRRNEAATAQQNVAKMDKSLRGEARSAIGDQVSLTAGLAEGEEALRQQALRESADLRGEVAQQEAAAFASQGQLANFDEAARQNAVAEAMNTGSQAFNMNRAIGGDVGNVVLSRSSAAPGMGQAAVAGAPAASQAYQPLFGDAIGTGINIGQTAMQTEQNRLNTQAEVSAANQASKNQFLGGLLKVGATMAGVPPIV